MNVGPELYRNDKLYGSTVVGTRGQVVVPAQARKDLGIRPGDRLIVIGKAGKALGFVKAEQLAEILGSVLEGIDGSEAKRHLRAHIEQVFGSQFVQKLGKRHSTSKH